MDNLKMSVMQAFYLSEGISRIVSFYSVSVDNGGINRTKFYNGRKAVKAPKKSDQVAEDILSELLWGEIYNKNKGFEEHAGGGGKITIRLKESVVAILHAGFYWDDFDPYNKKYFTIR